jgi:NDP-sugar pyrophosphorylase family protein
MLYNTTDEDKSVFPLPVRDRIWYDVNQIGSIVELKESLSYHQRRQNVFSGEK